MKLKILLLNLMIFSFYSQGADKDLPKKALKNRPSSIYNTENPLDTAIIFGDVEEVQNLIEEGVNINRKGTIGLPSEQAVLFKDFAITETLLTAGADPNTKFSEGLTPLQWAVLNNDLEITIILLKHGADPNTPFFEGLTPLQWAVLNNDLEFTKLLLEHNADPNLEFLKGINSKHLALLYLEPKAKPFLFESKKDLRDRINELESRKKRLHLISEVSLRDNTLSKKLKAKKARLTNKIKQAKSDTAKNYFGDDVIQMLSKPISSLPINKNFKALYKMSPLHIAVMQGNKKKIQELLEKGANPDTKNNKDYTALHIAVFKEYFGITELLLKYKANPNIRNNEGETALHISTLKTNFQITKLLLEHDADPNIANNEGVIPIRIAILNNSEMKYLLMSAETDLDSKDTKTLRIPHQKRELPAKEYIQKTEPEEFPGRKDTDKCKRPFKKSHQK